MLYNEERSRQSSHENQKGQEAMIYCSICVGTCYEKRKHFLKKYHWVIFLSCLVAFNACWPIVFFTYHNVYDYHNVRGVVVRTTGTDCLVQLEDNTRVWRSWCTGLEGERITLEVRK